MGHKETLYGRHMDKAIYLSYPSYQKLQEDNDRMSKRIEVIIRTARGSVSFTHAEDINTTSNPHINSSTYFQNSYQVERTITQYKGDFGVDTKLDPKSRVKYPYDKIINFVRNFLSFSRGCFVCGKEDHYCMSDCLKVTKSRDDYEKNQKLF